MQDRKGCARETVVVAVDVAVIVVIASGWTSAQIRCSSCCKGLPRARERKSLKEKNFDLFTSQRSKRVTKKMILLRSTKFRKLDIFITRKFEYIVQLNVNLLIIYNPEFILQLIKKIDIKDSDANLTLCYIEKICQN